MTDYGLRPPTTEQIPEWIKKKEARKKVLDGVKARRREQYKQFFSKIRQANKQHSF